MADPAVIKAVFDGMAAAFQPDKAAGVNAVLQYDITGDGGGTWYAAIADGACEVKEGAHESPNLTLTMSADDWVAMLSGELDGNQAFMSGKLKIAGDMSLAMKMDQFFAEA